MKNRKPKNAFGTWVRGLRVAYAEVGKMVGCSAQRVSNLMWQGQKPSLELASRIAKASDGKVPVSSWGAK